MGKKRKHINYEDSQWTIVGFITIDGEPRVLLESPAWTSDGEPTTDEMVAEIRGNEAWALYGAHDEDVRVEVFHMPHWINLSHPDMVFNFRPHEGTFSREMMLQHYLSSRNLGLALHGDEGQTVTPYLNGLDEESLLETFIAVIRFNQDFPFEDALSATMSLEDEYTHLNAHYPTFDYQVYSVPERGGRGRPPVEDEPVREEQPSNLAGKLTVAAIVGGFIYGMGGKK